MSTQGVWLNENRITTTSYPFISILFKAAREDASEFTLTSDFKELKDDKEGSGGITGAEIEGVVPYGRTGHINLIDPTGDWVNNLMTVGAQSSSFFGGTGPNLHITFGWRGLKPDKESTEYIREISGFIVKVEQDMTAEGVFTAVVHFVEYSLMALSGLRFLRKQDMINGLPDTLLSKVPANNKKNGVDATGVVARSYRRGDSAAGGPEGEKPSGTGIKPQDILKKICQGSDDRGNNAYLFSVAKQLEKKKIKLVFTGGNETEDVTRQDFPRIRFNDNLVAFIREVIAQMKPNEAALNKASPKGSDGVITEKYTLSYERGNAEYIPESISQSKTYVMPSYTRIPYYWKQTPVKSPKDLEEMYPPHPGEEGGPELILGPNLIYKYSGTNKNDKIIISWSSDLSSHSYLIHMFRDKLTEKFSGFTETDWSNLEEMFEKKGLDKTTETAEEKAKKLKEAASSGKTISDDKNFEYFRADQMIEAMTEVERAVGVKPTENRAASLRSVVMANAFKASAVLMGDPSIGTNLKGAETEFITDFSSVGDLAKNIFDRSWILLKSKHIFEAGKYTTNCELLGYPDPDEAARAEEQQHVAHYVPTAAEKEAEKRLFKQQSQH